MVATTVLPAWGIPALPSAVLAALALDGEHGDPTPGSTAGTHPAAKLPLMAAAVARHGVVVRELPGHVIPVGEAGHRPRPQKYTDVDAAWGIGDPVGPVPLSCVGAVAVGETDADGRATLTAGDPVYRCTSRRVDEVARLLPTEHREAWLASVRVYGWTPSGRLDGRLVDAIERTRADISAMAPPAEAVARYLAHGAAWAIELDRREMGQRDRSKCAATTIETAWSDGSHTLVRRHCDSWRCPTCAARATEALRVRLAAQLAQADGEPVAWVTLTLPRSPGVTPGEAQVAAMASTGPYARWTRAVRRLGGEACELLGIVEFHSDEWPHVHVIIRGLDGSDATLAAILAAAERAGWGSSRARWWAPCSDRPAHLGAEAAKTTQLCASMARIRRIRPSKGWWTVAEDAAGSPAAVEPGVGSASGPSSRPARTIERPDLPPVGAVVDVVVHGRTATVASGAWTGTVLRPDGVSLSWDTRVPLAVAPGERVRVEVVPVRGGMLLRPVHGSVPCTDGRAAVDHTGLCGVRASTARGRRVAPGAVRVAVAVHGAEIGLVAGALCAADPSATWTLARTVQVRHADGRVERRIDRLTRHSGALTCIIGG